jgi:hypothetical protein
MRKVIEHTNLTPSTQRLIAAWTGNELDELNAVIDALAIKPSVKLAD